jgi:hypothetical protein
MRYEPDLTKVQSSIPIFPKGTYEYSVGEPKAFGGTNRKGDPKLGVRYSVRCEEVHDGDQKFKGKRTIVSLYVHTEDAQGMAKRFILAALGYAVNEQGEKEFDAEYKGRDWSIDPETGAVGDVWREPTGKRVLSDCDIQAGDEGAQFQAFSWRPLNSAVTA